MKNSAPSEQQKMLGNGVLYQIAEAFDQSARQFKTENQRLMTLGKIHPVTNPLPRFQVGESTWVDYEADKGVNVNISPGEENRGLRLRLGDIGESKWFSFSYSINLEAARSARYIGLLVRAKSYGMAALRPCFRYIFDIGLQDTFAPQQLIWRGGEEEQLSFIRLDQQILARANALELLFFFSGRKFDITLLDIENLHI